MTGESDFPAATRPDLLPLFQGAKGYWFLLGLPLASYFYAHVPARETGDSALYLVNFLFFTGAGAGAIILGAVADASGLERLRPPARIAELVAISCLVLATVSMTLDVARPEQVRFLWGNAYFAPVLPWDVVALVVYVGNGMALGYAASQPDLVRAIRATRAIPRNQRLCHVLALARSASTAAAAPRERQVLRQLAVIFVSAGLLLDSVQALILGHLRTEPLWGPVLTPLLLIATTLVISLVLSLALVILVAAVSRPLLRVRVGEEVIRALGRVLLLVTVPLGCFLLMEIHVAARVVGLDVFGEMVTGSSAPLLWFVLVGGVIVPFLLLRLFPTRVVGGIGLGALLVALGVLAQRWNVISPPARGHADLPYAWGSYAPTGPELALSVAAYVAALLLCLALARRFAAPDPER